MCGIGGCGVVLVHSAVGGDAPLAVLATPPAGALHGGGERMVQADYARTVERLAGGGPAVFSKGEIAAEIAAAFGATGGFTPREAPASYPVNGPEPLRGTYRGRQVVGAGPP